MKFFLNMVKLVGISVIALTPISCDYILEKNHSDYEVLSNAQSRINVYKREATLLLEASKNNLDILEICENISEVDTQSSVSHLTKKLEKAHFEISKDYNELAEDKLISIPSYRKTNKKFKEVSSFNKESFLKNKLKLILNKTELQIQLLDALGNITNNIDFKVLVIRDTQKLKSNMDNIEITLSRLNQQDHDKRTKKLLL